jgi:hypothetical protein
MFMSLYGKNVGSSQIAMHMGLRAIGPRIEMVVAMHPSALG